MSVANTTRSERSLRRETNRFRSVENYYKQERLVEELLEADYRVRPGIAFDVVAQSQRKGA